MMKLLIALRLAVAAMRGAKLRTGLTVLGILIGVAAVVVVVALGRSVKDRVLGEIQSLGANTIYVFPQSTQASGVRQRSVGRLTEGDCAAIEREAISIAGVAPFSSTMAQVVGDFGNATTTVAGVTNDYWSVRGFSIEAGSTWTDRDESAKTRVVVIGQTVRDNLFGDRDPLGQTVRIGRHGYRIIGILAKKGQSPFGEDQDDRVLMPIGSFRARVLRSSTGRVQMILASATSAETVERASKQVESILRDRHGIDPEDEADFVVRTQAEFRKSQEAIIGTVSTLLSILAAVSLFIGGLGVMNIMWVSVVQRTREIGIRLAVGAYRRDILMQFLVEAVLVSLLGGLLGLAAGGLMLLGIGKLLDESMKLPFSAIVAAIATSMATGVIFGIGPAKKAADLDPIETLRYEG